MADTSGQAEIRGLDVTKLLVGFADQEIIFKKYIDVVPTSARQIRWYQKTSGWLGITSPANVGPVAAGTAPYIYEQSVTRHDDYVKEYFLGSPIITNEDIQDADVDVLAMNVRDLGREIEHRRDIDIWNAMTENQVGPTNILLVNCSGAWSAGVGVANPIADLMNAKTKIKAQGYNPEGGYLFVNASGAKNLVNWFINEKGSYIPQFASRTVESGVMAEVLGWKIVTNEACTNGYALVGNTKSAVWYKEFMPYVGTTIDHPLIGKSFLAKCAGLTIVHDPKALCLLSGCGTA